MAISKKGTKRRVFWLGQLNLFWYISMYSSFIRKNWQDPTTVIDDTITMFKKSKLAYFILRWPGQRETLTARWPGWRGEYKNPISSAFCEKKFRKSLHNQPLASQTWDYAKKRGVKSHACVPLILPWLQMQQIGVYFEISGKDSRKRWSTTKDGKIPIDVNLYRCHVYCILKTYLNAATLLTKPHS